MRGSLASSSVSGYLWMMTLLSKSLNTKVDLGGNPLLRLTSVSNSFLEAVFTLTLFKSFFCSCQQYKVVEHVYKIHKN